ncbi:MAG: class I SAM-dependent methyltransferase [Candidatus Coatesbacteria bacterium]
MGDAATPSHPYSGLTASTWDLHRDTRYRWDDAQLFLELVREYGQPALDLGCGTGRILLDFLDEGIDIDGVDNAPDMLAICRTAAAAKGKSPALFEQSLETLDLPRRYGTILGPSSVLQLVCGPAGALGALRRIQSHLVPGGAFITMFSFDWREGEPLDTGWQVHFEKPRPEDGAVIRAFTREWREPATRCWHTEERFEVLKDGKVVATELHRRSPEGRWYSQGEALALYQEAGFGKLQLFRDFTRSPAGPDDRNFCLLGIKS